MRRQGRRRDRGARAVGDRRLLQERRPEVEQKFHDGWLRTGDVGIIDELGYITLTDRAKDVIKSGGEWISSVDLENALMAHDDVRRGRGGRHPRREVGTSGRWPVVLREGAARHARGAARVPVQGLREVAAARRWAFIDEVPRTSVGKFDKKVIRKRYADDELDVKRPSCSAAPWA